MVTPDNDRLSKIYKEDKWRILRYQDVYRGRNGAKFHIGRCSFLLELPEDHEFSPNGGPGTGSLPSVFLPPTRADSTTAPGVLVVQAIPLRFSSLLGALREIGCIRGIPRDRTGAAAGCVKAAFDAQLQDLPDVFTLYTLRHTAAGRSTHGVHELLLSACLTGTRRDNNARGPLGFPDTIGTTVSRELYGIPVQYGACSSVFQSALPDPTLITPLPTATISGILPVHGCRTSVTDVWRALSRDNGIPVASIRSIWVERGSLRAPHKGEAAFDTIIVLLRGTVHPDCPSSLMDKYPASQYHVRADLGGPRTATLSLYQDIRGDNIGAPARPLPPAAGLPQRSRAWRASENSDTQNPQPCGGAAPSTMTSPAAELADEDLLKTIRQLRKENAELKARQIDIKETLDRLSEKHAQERAEAQAHRRRELELQKVIELVSQLAVRQASFEQTVFDQLSTLDSLIREGLDLPDDLQTETEASESDRYDLPEGTFSEIDSDSGASFRPSVRPGKTKKTKIRPPSPTAGAFVPHPSFAPFFGDSSPGSGRPPTGAMTSSRPPTSTAGCADQVTGRGIGLKSPAAHMTSASIDTGGDRGRGKLTAKGPLGTDSTPATLQKKPSHS